MQKHVELWHKAKEDGIILVPWKTNNSYIVAAIPEHILDSMMEKAGFQSNEYDWDDIFDNYSLGAFVSVSAPGEGGTLKEAYEDALRTYHKLIDNE